MLLVDLKGNSFCVDFIFIISVHLLVVVTDVIGNICWCLLGAVLPLPLCRLLQLEKRSWDKCASSWNVSGFQDRSVTSQRHQCYSPGDDINVWNFTCDVKSDLVGTIHYSYRFIRILKINSPLPGTINRHIYPTQCTV